MVRDPGSTYLETALVVLDAPVQIQGGGAELAILMLAAIGPQSRARPVDVVAGIGKFRGAGRDGDGEEGKQTEVHEELHDGNGDEGGDGGGS